MTVIMFPPHVRTRGGSWQACELARLVESVEALADGDAAPRWDTGATELGDPQLYVLGPLPEEECAFCMSRLGPVYVLQDATGRILFEHNSLAVFAAQARKLMIAKKASLAARMGLLWCALRQTIEDKFETLWSEGEELIVHVGPQVAALT